ncbi:hypothetical protein [Haliangium ochraceum]|nr:hypothetical protein [Haliangium ochraceum]
MQAARDLRVFVYAGFDLLLAVLYALLLFVVVPNRIGWAQVLFALVCAALAAMGAAMLLRRPWSWWLGVGACLSLLALTAVLLLLLVMSAALLAGVYGSFGQAGALLTLVIAALVIEGLALLPALQLGYLLKGAGRRAFGRS